MQIPSIPPPIVTNILPQDVVAKAAPHMQAVKPLIQRPVDPSPKAEKFNESRQSKDRSRGRDRRPDRDDDRAPDGSVNLSV